MSARPTMRRSTEAKATPPAAVKIWKRSTITAESPPKAAQKAIGIAQTLETPTARVSAGSLAAGQSVEEPQADDSEIRGSVQAETPLQSPAVSLTVHLIHLWGLF